MLVTMADVELDIAALAAAGVADSLRRVAVEGCPGSERLAPGELELLRGAASAAESIRESLGKLRGAGDGA